MAELFFGSGAGWFAVPAIVGTALFLIRVVMLLVGHHGGDVHADVAIDADHGDPGEAFKALSIQSLAAFMMGFGWGGLGSLKGQGWHWSTSIVIGAIAGVAMVWLLAILLKGVYDLRASGNISIHQALGREGDVYLTVPAQGQGRGQVRVTIEGNQRIYNAVSDGAELTTSARVRVARVNEDNTLTVTPA